MKIDEAIKILKRKQATAKSFDRLDDYQAIGLGIEALKWIKWRRENYCQPPILPLPGETNV